MSEYFPSQPLDNLNVSLLYRGYTCCVTDKLLLLKGLYRNRVRPPCYLTVSLSCSLHPLLSLRYHSWNIGSISSPSKFSLSAVRDLLVKLGAISSMKGIRPCFRKWGPICSTTHHCRGERPQMEAFVTIRLISQVNVIEL